MDNAAKFLLLTSATTVVNKVIAGAMPKRVLIQKQAVKVIQPVTTI